MPRKFPKLRVTEIPADDDAPAPRLPDQEYFSELEIEDAPANCLYRLNSALAQYKDYTFDLNDMRMLIEIVNIQLRRMANAPDNQNFV